MRHWVLYGCVLLGAPALVHAQAQKPAPVEDRSSGTAPPQLLQQQRATVSYRDVTQAAYETRLAEQDVLNLQDSYNAARERADLLKVELDKAVKARDAAKAKEAEARKRYDDALK
jgi:hypothetical protein